MKKPTLKQLDAMWAKAIKARAGNKSEYSQKTGILHAHHINGKATHRLRWELNNGVCLTAGEHKFIAHKQDRAIQFWQWAMKLRGMDSGKILRLDRFGVYLYLKQAIENYGGKL